MRALILLLISLPLLGQNIVTTVGGNLDIANKGGVIELPNSSTGTVLNKLAKVVVTGGVLQAQIITTSAADQLAAIGVVVGGAGTTGNAQILIVGTGSSFFDGNTVAGHIAVPSATSAGALSDTGSTSAPTNGGEVVATVGTTNAACSVPCLIAGNVFMTPDLVAGAGNGGGGGGGPLRGSGTSPDFAYWSAARTLNSAANLLHNPFSNVDLQIGSGTHALYIWANDTAGGPALTFTSNDTSVGNAVLRSGVSGQTVLNTQNGTQGVLAENNTFVSFWRSQGNDRGFQMNCGACNFILPTANYFQWDNPADLSTNGTIAAGDLLKITTNGYQRTTAGDTNGAVAISLIGTSNNVAMFGNVCMKLDSGSANNKGDYVVISATNDGQGHGVTPASYIRTQGQIVGRTSNLAGGGGNCSGSLTEVVFDPNAGSNLIPSGTTPTNCASTASPAVCGSAPAGAAAIPAASATVVVNTTAVTANSEINVTEDQGLGTRLSATCNTQSSLVVGSPRVTARTAGTSFTVGVDVAPTANPLCFNYTITN